MNDKKHQKNQILIILLFCAETSNKWWISICDLVLGNVTPKKHRCIGKLLANSV